MGVNKLNPFIYILVFISLFIGEYISNTFGSVIKACIISSLFIQVIKLKEISYLLILFCITFIFNPYSGFSSGQFHEVIQIIYFPVSFFYILYYFKNKKSLLILSQLFSHTIIFSSLFFILNILDQNLLVLNQLEGLHSKFDDISKDFLHFGFFDHPQVASKLYTLSFMIILFKREKRYIDYIALILGIYVIYITYVRLAWLALFFTLILFIFHQKNKWLKIFFFISLSLLVVYTIPFIADRLLNYSDNFSITNLSSGRDLLIQKSILFVQKSKYYAILLGNGHNLVMTEIGYTHNRLFEIFIIGGLFSLLIWFIIYRKILIIIKPNLKRNYLLISICFLIIISILFSHGFSAYLAILASAAILSSTQK